MESYDFRLVSPTAVIPAFARGDHTDIPWAKEMVTALRERGVDLSSSPWSETGAANYAAFMEARFKSVNHILKEHGSSQVLELASGLSPRGMDLAQRGVVYVEADLPESVARKREIVTAILGAVPANLHLCAASVIDREQLLACAAVFGKKPVAVTTEGLLRYLTFDEKRRLSANVLELLARFGGMWVTTDIHLRKFLLGHRRALRHATETERLGRDLDPNYFDDLDHARQFFEECGFEVESRPLLDGIRERVVSLPTASPELMDEMNERRTFILRASRS